MIPTEKYGEYDILVWLGVPRLATFLMIPEIRSELSTLHDGRWRTADITPTSAAGVASGSLTDVYNPTIAFATMVPHLYVDPVAGEKDTHT